MKYAFGVKIQIMFFEKLNFKHCAILFIGLKYVRFQILMNPFETIFYARLKCGKKKYIFQLISYYIDEQSKCKFRENDLVGKKSGKKEYQRFQRERNTLFLLVSHHAFANPFMKASRFQFFTCTTFTLCLNDLSMMLLI